ncbi:hypothetical protein BH11MYX1_BH11MYX1_02570 [soil metagenome]
MEIEATEVGVELLRRVRQAKLVLPPYPAVAAKLQQLPRDTSSLAAVAAIVGTDAVLAANVLRAASSAAQSTATVPTTLEAAVYKLGFEALVRLAIAVSLGASASAGGPLAELRRNEWRRSLISGVICRDLAQRRGLDPSHAFLAGLLHDFGAIVAIAGLESIGALPTWPAPRWRKLVDELHVELGVLVAASWKLPAPIADVIAHHHAPAGHGPLVQLVAMVDHVIAILYRGAMTGIAALIEVPGMRTEERYQIGMLMPKIAEAMDQFETAAKAGPSAVEPPRTLEDGWDVDFDVVSRRGVTYHVCAIAANQLALASEEPMNPGWLTEFRFGGDAVEIMVNVVTCTPRAGGDFLVVLQPFALGGEGKKVWLGLLDDTRAQAPRAAM